MMIEPILFVSYDIKTSYYFADYALTLPVWN
jgi:hypothetical protein